MSPSGCLRRSSEKTQVLRHPPLCLGVRAVGGRPALPRASFGGPASGGGWWGSEGAGPRAGVAQNIGESLLHGVSVGQGHAGRGAGPGQSGLAFGARVPCSLRRAGHAAGPAGCQRGRLVFLLSQRWSGFPFKSHRSVKPGEHGHSRDLGVTRPSLPRTHYRPLPGAGRGAGRGPGRGPAPYRPRRPEAGLWRESGTATLGLTSQRSGQDSCRGPQAGADVPWRKSVARSNRRLFSSSVICGTGRQSPRLGRSAWPRGHTRTAVLQQLPSERGQSLLGAAARAPR